VVKFIAELGLPFEVKAEELTDPDPKEMLVFALYLYQTLPQFVPKTKIEFACKLGESVVSSGLLATPGLAPVHAVTPHLKCICFLCIACTELHSRAYDVFYYFEVTL